MNQLMLRSWPMIALAYLLGPFVGLNLLYAATTLLGIYRPDFDPEGAATGWFISMVFGGFVCLIIEIVVVTPLLIGFSRHRWPWLNGFSGAAIGFLLGAIPWLALVGPRPTMSPDQIPGSITACTNGHCTEQGWGQAGHTARVVWEINGRWTLAGWVHVAQEVALMGMVGLIAAVVFRMVAVHSAEQPTQLSLEAGR